MRHAPGWCRESTARQSLHESVSEALASHQKSGRFPPPALPTGVMTASVIDRLKVVDIAQDERHTVSRMAGGNGETLKVPAIGKPRERVGACEPLL